MNKLKWKRTVTLFASATITFVLTSAIANKQPWLAPIVTGYTMYSVNKKYDELEQRLTPRSEASKPIADEPVAAQSAPEKTAHKGFSPSRVSRPRKAAKSRRKRNARRK